MSAKRCYLIGELGACETALGRIYEIGGDAMRFTPHDYQRFAIDFIKEHTNAAVFLDMGLGKTVITLTALDDLLFDSFEVSRVLVVCPLRVAKTTWPQEIAKWDHLRHLRYSVVVGTPKERVAALGRPAELYIINRENVEWLVKHYAGRKLPFDMLVIDELSSFKNSRAKRFLALKKVLGQFTRVVGLTGTPAPNGLEDLWPQIYLLDRGALAWAGRCAVIWTCISIHPTAGCPYKRELKPGAEEAIYQRISDICVSMRAADHLKMPERVDNVVEISLSSREEKAVPADGAGYAATLRGRGCLGHSTRHRSLEAAAAGQWRGIR